jgi:hypothetical protein
MSKLKIGSQQQMSLNAEADSVASLVAAFERLADRYADRPTYGGFKERDVPQYNWGKVGVALGEILSAPHNADQRHAAQQIHRLIGERGCTPIELAAFLFDCSRGVGSSVSQLLDSAGFDKTRIKKLRQSCISLASEINKFNSSLPGPITYLDIVWKKTGLTRELREMFPRLPEFLSVYAGTIDPWPPSTPPNKAHMDDYRRFGKNWLLCYFYLYLKQVGGSYSTLSLLLTVMRDAWFQAFPEGQRALENKTFETAVNQFPFLIYAQRKRGEVKQVEIDPLGVTALQKAVSEFSRNNRNSISYMKKHIKSYFDEAKYAKLREQGATFLELLGSF